MVSCPHRKLRKPLRQLKLSSQPRLQRPRRPSMGTLTSLRCWASDNLFKFAFTGMVTYQLSVSWLPPALAGLVIGALFILPFLLFSATSGHLTDKFKKRTSSASKKTWKSPSCWWSPLAFSVTT